MTEAEQASKEFLRMTRDEAGVIQTVETALARLAAPDPAGDAPTVDLVGVVHIADRGYYDLLNAELAGYEAVLFEGILPRRRQVPQPHDKGAFAVMCRGIARRLGLEYQTDCLDYTRPNFLHADMVQSEFQRSIKRRKESFLGVSPNNVGQPAMKQEELNKAISDGMIEFARRFVSDEDPLHLKRTFAFELMGAVGATMDMFFGAEGSTLGSERNRIALRTLKSRYKKGVRKFALLYGCAHMSDFERQLGELYGLRRVEERWLVAWDLRPRDSADFAGFRS
jgi:hypothetical protein